jgi:GDP-D-mannose 3',5'-epimerase
MSTRTKKTLVTGGAGMIGSTLVHRLVELGTDVYVVDSLLRGKKDYLLDERGQPIINFEKRLVIADLRTPGVIDSLGVAFDQVFHLADVVAGIGFVFANQLSIFRDNLLINSNVVDSMRHIKPAGYIYVGTACSFPAQLQDGTYQRPLVEEDQYPANPESAYGWSKLMGEYEAFLLSKEHGIPVSVLSLHNVYGPPCDFSPERSQVIPSLIRKALRYPREDFVVWGSGRQSRAFVYVDDVVRALVATAERGLGTGLIQIGPSQAVTIAEVARLIVEISGKSIEVKFDTSKPEGDRLRCANFAKARRILGWNPLVDMRIGLDRLFTWIAARIKPQPINGGVEFGFDRM